MGASPFVILALPRSRTYWLSRFLSYREWNCGHEQLRYMRSLEDVKAWLSQDYTGTAETGAASWWRLIPKYRPDAKVLVVRRPIDEVVESLMRLGIPEFDRSVLTAQMRRLDAKLDQIERRLPNVLSVQFSDLVKEDVCAMAFEHCLPYPHDSEWWSRAASFNLQISMPAMVRYARAHRDGLARLARSATQEIKAELSRRPISISGIVIAREPGEKFLKDGKALFAEHSVQVGEAPSSYLDKNIPLLEKLESLGNLVITVARCNGRMFGYLMTVLSPSLESTKTKIAVHTAFYASPLFPGLGLKLQRAAIETLRESGVDELFMRAGVRGDGPRSSVIFRRLGAVQDGELFRLQIKD
jgi:hypothetical protein